ncbi:hypothetical protein JTE90_012944 [Oedothorax gibbosus]|uniref:Uncharacterized protein n=1 Tax=Oedothorax gibbosus TaxID=931172 RepID=A0AAV6TIW0_9ARAC|nr:hypothetical protein JTE90_012944 [Oedothorax gibbosus]
MGTDRPKITTLSPSDFQGPTRRTGHRKRPRCFLRETASYLRTSRFRTTNSYKRKDNSSPGPSVDVSEFWFRTALGPEGPISVSGVGEY